MNPSRPEFLDLAVSYGATLTGKPNGTESITVVFTIEAWRKFDAAVLAQQNTAPMPDLRPICSMDGCYRREPCGPFCNDNGNFDKPIRPKNLPTDNRWYENQGGKFVPVDAETEQRLNKLVVPDPGPRTT